MGLIWFEMVASPAFDPLHFGAIPDGQTLSTEAIQRAINAARDAGGGTVHLTAGKYLSGTLDLWSGVTLQVDKDATLLGSARIADYRRGKWPALIKARDQHQVAIIGEGTICGQGGRVAADTDRIKASHDYLQMFPGLEPGQVIGTVHDKGEKLDPYALQREGRLGAMVFPGGGRAAEFVRPQLLEFWHCQRVRVAGVTLRDAACWVQTYRDCEDVVIEAIQVRSTAYWNNDGIDLVNCRRVLVTQCDLDSADDGICLKTEGVGAGCSDITIAHCRIRSSASALKLGTASYCDFRHIRAHDLEIYDTFRSAVALESVDGGTLEDIEVWNVRARNTGNAFFLRLGRRNLEKPPGVLRHVLLRDFEVEIPMGKPDASYPHAGPAPREVRNLIPASIAGITGSLIEDITMRNIKIRYGGGGRRNPHDVPLASLDRVPERPSDYPEFSMFGELPAWGLFLRHAKNVSLENVSLGLAAPDYRAAIVADDVQNLAMDQVTIPDATEEPVVVLNNVAGVTLRRMSWPEGARENVRQQGVPPEATK